MEDIVHFFRSIWGLWLMGLFLFAVFWAYRPRNKNKFEEAANIPLNDEPTGPASDVEPSDAASLKREEVSQTDLADKV